jgi:hypothetical protein
MVELKSNVCGDWRIAREDKHASEELQNMRSTKE